MPVNLLLDLRNLVRTDAQHVAPVYTSRSVGYAVKPVLGKHFVQIIRNVFRDAELWLLDLRDLVRTDAQHITLVYNGRSEGYVVGSMLGGVILDLFESKEAVLTACNFVISGTMLGIPWSSSLGLLTGFMAISGITMGTINIGCNVVCLKLWGSNNAPFFQALHFTYGLGSLISPLVAAPFLGDPSRHLSSNLSASEPIDDGAVPSIVYPFTIIGTYGLVVSALFLAVCILDPTETKRPQSGQKEAARPSLGLLATLVLLTCALLFLQTGTEVGYAQMLTTYAVKGPLQLSPSTGSYMTSAFWAAFTVARLISIFLAIKVSNLSLIVGDLVVMWAGALLLLWSHEWSLWLSSVLLGAGTASFFPAAIGWLDSYVDVTNKIASLLVVGASFGETVFTALIGSFADAAPEVLIYVVLAACALISVLLVGQFLVLRNRPLKTEGPDTPQKPVAGPVPDFPLS